MAGGSIGFAIAEMTPIVKRRNQLAIRIGFILSSILSVVDSRRVYLRTIEARVGAFKVTIVRSRDH